MSDLVDQVEAMLEGIVKERVREHLSMCSQLLGSVERERDAARAELAQLAAQRDSWMAKSIALAEQLHTLQSAATPTPAAEPVEVDGFRVGDLVRTGSDARPLDAWWPAVVRVVESTVWIGYSQDDIPCRPSDVVRKPVEVGDTVRTRHSNRAEVIQGPDRDGRILFAEEDGVVYSAPLCTCIAIAPKVKP